MRNQHLASHSSATFPSPVIPCLEDQIVGTPKYWSSERVPHSKYSTRRHVVNASALLPFSSGRTLPSKWDDAERWISSPVMGQQGGHHSSKSVQIMVQSQRRARSKSGPLDPQMFVNCGNYSPSMPVLQGGGSVAVDSLLLGSAANVCGGGGGRRSCPGQAEEELACTGDWFELLSEPRPSSSQDEKVDGNQDPDPWVTRGISRRDMGTQMLHPENSSVYSSPSTNHWSPASSSPPPPMQPPHTSASNYSTETEVVVARDVEVDKEDTCKTRKCPRKYRRKTRKNRSLPSQEVNETATEFRASPRSITESHIAISKLQREEAKINAWENLQKAKAEAAIRKVEIKLEKKRSSSVEKILKKLERAEMKAERMRSSLSDGGRSCYPRRTSDKVDWLCWKIRISSIRSCRTR